MIDTFWPRTVVFKLITGRHSFWEIDFQLQIQNHAARGINSITETDLWKPPQKVSLSTDTDSLLISNSFLLFTGIDLGLKRN